MISISLKSTLRYCFLCFMAGSAVGPVAVPALIAFILAKLREWGVGL
jgi:hypothetical protein